VKRVKTQKERLARAVLWLIEQVRNVSCHAISGRSSAAMEVT
jgi:hypothetical protein